MPRVWSLLLVILTLVTSSCAATPRRPPQAGRRLKDSPVEVTAAHRSAAPRSLELEKEDERWAVDPARARTRGRADDAAQASPRAPRKSADVVEPDRSR